MALNRTYGTVTQLAISLDNLAEDSTGYFGRQSEIISNLADGWDEIHVNISVGVTVEGGSVLVRSILGDGNRRTDNASLLDSDRNGINSPTLGAIITPSADIYIAQFIIPNPSVQWGIHITNRTNGPLDITGNEVYWFGASYNL